ncbi:MAG: cobalamin-binding protein [Nitrospiraceae bacterium]|nr:MAG: cobalamin-binding protein [Nitrospiraceae bacterium]
MPHEEPSWYKVVRVKVIGFYPRLSSKAGVFYFLERYRVAKTHKGRHKKAKRHRDIGVKKIRLFFLLCASVPLFLCACLFSLLSLNFLLLTSAFAEPPQRIVSLAPSTTEILFAAGLGNKIVGVTTFCDYPEEAKSKPKIGGMSNPSMEAVISLKPDIVIMTTDGNPKAFEQRLISMNIRTYVFRARTIAQLPDGIRRLGQEIEEEDKFNKLALDIKGALNDLQKGVQAGNKKVLFMIWPEPLMVAGPGTAIHDAIHLLGAINIAGDAKIQYPKYSIEEIVHRSPDIIFIGKAYGMDMQKTAVGLLSRISYIPAVKNNNVYYVSDHLYRLGPRIIPGIKELAGYLNK